jgi:hypothetical protein
MAANPEQVISLNVHGNDQYDKVVFERYQKLEKAQNARQEQAKKESMQPLVPVAEEKNEDEFNEHVNNQQE